MYFEVDCSPDKVKAVNINLLSFKYAKFWSKAPYRMNLRVEPTSPIQAMSFSILISCSLFLTSKNYKIMEKKH